MSNLQLASAAAIAAAIANPDFASILSARKAQLVARLQAAPNEIDATLPVVLSQTDDLTERAFLRALVVSTVSGTAPALSNDVRSGFAPGITSVGDSAAGSLESVLTIGLAKPALRVFYNVPKDREEDWLLEPSTAVNHLDGDGQPDTQRPNDFDLSSNPNVWFRKR